MSNFTRLDIVATVIQSVVIILVIAKSIKLVMNAKTNFLPFFFALAITGYLLSNLYWIAYDLLKPDTRMPMACNEVGECAMILLLCAGLETELKDKKKIPGEVAFAVFFMGANIALWIVWSGEWFQDILFGIPYVYLFWLLIRGLRSRCSMTSKELWLAAVTSMAVLAMQIPLLMLKGALMEPAKAVCFAVMFALMAWLGIKSVRDRDFFVSSTFFLWTELSMFLSSDIYYYIAYFANTVALIFMFASMKRELVADG